MARLELSHLTKSFGTAKVLHGIDLAVRDREFVVFVGPSGCGKSTLLRIIAGLEEASSGRILIDGVDVSRAAPVDRGISMVFQSYALYPHLTVFENIAFPLRVARLPEEEVRQKVGRAADILQLNDKLHLKPGQLSGGQRQRVAIGRSIVRNPRVFLFDEPLSNLDAALRGEMRVELSALQRDLDATMIYVTHDQIEAMTMAHRIVVLNKGRIEQFGTPMELYHHPATRFVATFIGQPNMNLLPATVVGTAPDGLTVDITGGAQITLPVAFGDAKIGDTVEVGIRPENLTLGAGLTMKLRVLERLGGVAIAYGVMLGGPKICAALAGDSLLHEGEDIGLSFAPQDAHVFDANGAVMPRLQAPSLADEQRK
ncbi:ABC transporter ATP-binding protein [Cypionkella sp.]|uniref:ABC transporter ATP-binding protein n=1 Tax=Cypionkella sp. TaxID=2811411 RepID=UPI00274BF1D6|nr:ABC transporter ATP-binding protein [Cypionkella sp.]